MGGRCPHAIRKPKPGDFRAQAEYGGTVEPARPAAQVIEQAAAALACAPTPTLYARVDGCEVNGTFQLMELELIEPWLFFLEEPGAAGKFVRELSALLTAGGRSG